ncbi:PREDICTED: DNA-directed RNA polymerase III subunit RPC7 [Tauraco erythrolophus]|uniref:DNA-directed RNA polymerase III subunit RPC7 n=1 Tax=Tauraco erythrolophus TaxID=121530 RepID=UPI000523E66D|nr:PREDICTED: DNA-directed RNA polymerase III subunit RPC7 [Tauraco erythrolophus]
MAGSGRERGRAAFTFNIETLGFARGAALPDVVSKPPPPFPSTDNKPVPLKTGEDEDYMLALKQDLRGTMKKMPYFLAVEEEREAIERYSKKYQDSEKEHATWTPAFFCRIVNQVFQQQLELAKTSQPQSNLDVLKKIEELEKKDDEEEKSEDEKDKPKDQEGEDDEEPEEPEEYDEEEQEEANDYISSYFEDGDDFGAASDDNMDEATY